jgi:type I restriction enzyme S subunit
MTETLEWTTMVAAEPSVRFSDFHGAWKVTQLGDVSRSIASGRTKHRDSGSIEVYGSTGLIGWADEATHDGEFILVARVGANAGLTKRVEGKFAVTDNTLVIDLDDTVNASFIEAALHRFDLNKLIFGSGQPLVTGGQLKALKLRFPTLPEQQKIGAFLGAVDRKIQQLKRKQALLEQYKKGVVQQLFAQELRFKREDGGEFPEWEERELSEVLTEHKLSSTGQEEVYSVSVHKSLINQVEHLGRVYAAENTDHYNRVLPGDMVYTKSPTGEFKYGIIKQSRLDKAVIVSPLYGVFTPETRALGYWLDAYFESILNTYNYLHPIVQKGAKNTIAVTNRTFLSGTLLLPLDKEEQEKIAGFLIALDAKVAGVAQAVAATQKWKRGLLQQMFV